MTVVAVMGAVVALVLVGLAYVVGRLQGDVRRLSFDLHALRSVEPEPPVVATTLVPVTRPEGRSPSSERVDDSDSRAADVDVPVITVMAESPDESDLTVARVASVTLARPLIRVAALSYGLRRALGDERRFRIRYAMRQEFRRQRKIRRRRRSGWAPSNRWRQ